MKMMLKQFDDPDGVTNFPLGKFETVTLGGMTIGRATYQPGWKWSDDVGPGVGARYCTVEHVGMVVSGTAAVAFPGGQVTENETWRSVLRVSGASRQLGCWR